MTTQATPGALGSNDQLGPLPEPHLHTAALAVMNAGWERGGHVYSAAQMHAYASQEVAAALERFVEALADACMAAEIPDSKFESLLIGGASQLAGAASRSNAGLGEEG